MRPDLAHDVANMDLDGVFAHAELVGGDLIGFTLAQSVEDLGSQAGKKGEIPVCRAVRHCRLAPQARMFFSGAGNKSGVAR